MRDGFAEFSLHKPIFVPYFVRARPTESPKLREAARGVRRCALPPGEGHKVRAAAEQGSPERAPPKSQ